MSFEGFSEEDIKRLKDNTCILEKTIAGQLSRSNSLKRGALRNSGKKIDPVKKTAKQTTATTSQTSKAVGDIPDSAKLDLKEEKEKVVTTKPIVTNLKQSLEHKKPKNPELHDEQKLQNGTAIKENKENNSIVKLDKTSLNSSADSSFKESVKNERSINLSEFEAKQKLLEEQNRKRKELLAKALADRTKQTQEETQRLNEIQNEFKKLDAILSNDVKILRRQIDVASADYYEAEKKYKKIEKEYLEAKIFMHQKLERKQMLTEHLCAIIEKNEERKAEKLNELLQKLQLGSQV